MDLLNNPFRILGASLRDNRQKILELADDMSLVNDADLCMEARAELTNPRKRLKAEMDIYIHKRQTSQNAFTIKYKESLKEDTEQWSECTKILSRQDIKKRTSNPW